MVPAQVIRGAKDLYADGTSRREFRHNITMVDQHANPLDAAIAAAAAQEANPPVQPGNVQIPTSYGIYSREFRGHRGQTRP